MVATPCDLSGDSNTALTMITFAAKLVDRLLDRRSAAHLLMKFVRTLVEPNLGIPAGPGDVLQSEAQPAAEQLGPEGGEQLTLLHRQQVVDRSFACHV